MASRLSMAPKFATPSAASTRGKSHAPGSRGSAGCTAHIGGGQASAPRPPAGRAAGRGDNGAQMNPGLAYAVLAYTASGLFPLYFAMLAQVSALEIVLHRTLWSLAVVLGLLAALRRWSWVRPTLADPRRLALCTLSALLLAGNWTLYVRAVLAQRVVDASLGYFITPLVSVLLGVLVLRERLNRAQWAAVALAGAGVAWLTGQAGQLPWIGLTLAASFGLYGLMRKTAPLGALEGLAVETLLLAAPAAALLAAARVRRIICNLGHDGPRHQGRRAQDRARLHLPADRHGLRSVACFRW